MTAFDSQPLGLATRCAATTSIATSAIVFFLLVALPAPSSSATFEIFPASGGCNEQFENLANALQPGDELVLHGGTYSQDCARNITVVGTAAAPITIRAATGETPTITHSNPATQNNIEINNSRYLTIKGIKFQGGSTGVRFMGTSSNITFEDNEILNPNTNAITLNSGNFGAITIRRNHIHHTGLGSGTVEGEGMYLGCHDGSCRVTNSLIEGNYIHHLRSTSTGGNDGIEVKVGSSGNTIKDNVIHDTNLGTVQYPCIFVYGGGSAVNVVEGNAVWNCGEAIVVVADAVIRNNLILNSSITGITAAPHAANPTVRNVTIVNNTIYGHPQCLYIRWSGATNMILANNAVYCPGGSAVNASGLTGSSVTVRSNYLEGNLSGATIDNSRFFSGGSATSAFVNVLGFDLWPLLTSVLIGRADAAHVSALDFNGAIRTAPYDVGAYETEALPTNPGWRVGPGFKPTGGQAGTPPATPTNLRAQ